MIYHIFFYPNRLQEVRDKAQAMNGFSNTNFTFVSIHSRRTDYERHLKILFNLTFVDTSYYFNAMEFFKTKFEVIFHNNLFSACFKNSYY